MGRSAIFAAGALLAVGAACRTPAPPPPELEREPPARAGDAMIVGGERVSIGTRVVTWTEAPYYSAYPPHPRFSDDGPQGARYRPGRDVPGPWRAAVDQFVIHYDACGTSRRCFEVLQDQRKLSVHFLLDVDGTLYQTLDLCEQAWHARQANPRSVGVEVANVGAYPAGDTARLDAWYGDDQARVRGVVQGRQLVQHDFTPEQYDALVKLGAGLCRTFPNLAPDAPRDAGGKVRSTALSAAQLDTFRGMLGHLHVTTAKIDPGPAFDWEGYLARVRGELGP